MAAREDVDAAGGEVGRVEGRLVDLRGEPAGVVLRGREGRRQSVPGVFRVRFEANQAPAFARLLPQVVESIAIPGLQIRISLNLNFELI